MITIGTPRLVVAALKGGSGKTIATLGTICAWRNKGLRVASFKKGPDYIDAGWLSLAAGNPCYNLDPFLMPKDTILSSFHRRGQGVDVAVVEGNRGLFDGVDKAGTCSTAELAKWLKAPVVLVVDCTKVTRTAAAMVLGCLHLDPGVDVSGVILNHVARSRHEAIVTNAIESYTNVKVLGVMPRMRQDPLPMRHLGVTPCKEHPEAVDALERLSTMVAGSIDLDALEEVARGAPPVRLELPRESREPGKGRVQAQGFEVKIGVLRDAAFQFYYPENLEALEEAGARLVFLDATRDRFPSELHGLYIGGGFPETQAERLGNNAGFRQGLLHAIERGLPVYAECGGLMYLGEHIVWQGRSYPMVGALSWDFVLGRRPAGHGYSIVEVVTDTNPFFPRGTTLQGHEFHYSKPVPTGGPRPGTLTCRVVRGHGFDGRGEGIAYRNAFGTYTHIHALERRDWGAGMVRAATLYKASLDQAKGDPASPVHPGHERSGRKILSLTPK